MHPHLVSAGEAGDPQEPTGAPRLCYGTYRSKSVTFTNRHSQLSPRRQRNVPACLHKDQENTEKRDLAAVMSSEKSRALAEWLALHPG
uniref:Uncharacterized protein n=1 Tax=Knipowitschia caucasica TaxID=637954 RepID=A0AAV2MES0_KNICA